MSPALRLDLSKASSITVSEFYNVFQAACRIQRSSTTETQVPRIGIAVSGGVDSMALAHLCSSLRIYPPESDTGRTSFTAFIIDHKSRDGSSREAQMTVDRLRRMGLPGVVIPLKWSTGVLPPTLPDFETQARRLRYQALGKACSKHGIRQLLLAHHCDDLAETTLMRLAAGQTGDGLSPMRQYARIPECWGIYGVDQSGAYDAAVSKLRSDLVDKSNHTGPLEAALNDLLGAPPVFEDGGVSIVRPLLTYSKEQLVQTCKTNRVQWEEDASNQDATLTPRNAIRSLLQDGKLPQALRKSSLLGIAQRKLDLTKQLAQAEDQIFQDCKVQTFDARSGMLTIRLLESVIHPKETCEAFSRCAAARCTKYLASIVSPNEIVTLQSVYNQSAALFPTRASSASPAPTSEKPPTSFTAGGVQFQRLTNPIAGNPAPDDQKQQEHLDPDFVWVLSRQPFSSTPIPLIIPPSPAAEASRLSESSHTVHNQRQHWSPWQLWDGRYWIRILNKTSKELRIRGWASPELAELRNRVPPSTFGKFHDLLKVAAPGKIRWTLPVVAEADADCQDDGEAASSHGIGGRRERAGKILAFPTLGKAGWLDVVSERGERVVEWEVRYKRTDMTRLDQKRSDRGSVLDTVVSWDD